MARALLLPVPMHELRVAARALAARPSFTLSVVLTLALGIGATTMMFALLDAAILRPLPFREAGALVLAQGVAGQARDVRGASFPEVADWRTMNRSLEDLAIYDETSLNMTVGSEAVRVQVEMVGASYFQLLGASAAAGRTFLPEEDVTPDAHAVIVVSDRFARERFGGANAAVSRTVTLNDRACAIVGVMPAGFAGLSFDTDVWIPSMMVSLTASAAAAKDRGSRWLFAVGRLRDGVTVAQAQEDFDRVARQLEQEHPQTNRERGVQLLKLQDALLGNSRTLIVVLFTAVVLFLLVACANVASLQVARTTARQREMAVRRALGARKWHLVRQLVAESMLLAAVAGIAGAIVAAWATSAVVSAAPDGALPAQVSPDVDPRVLLFTAAITIAVGLLVALLPALVERDRDLATSMKIGARDAAGGIGSLRRPSTQQLLVVGELALAMLLLTGAGLVARSLQQQMRVPLGFESEGVTVGRVSLPAARYAPPQRIAFAERLQEELAALPGVRAASVSSDLPLTGTSSASLLVTDARPDTSVRYFRHFTTPAYFATLGIRVVRGRAFTPQDRAGTPLVAMISESGARRLWGDPASAVGRRFKLGNAAAPEVEIVGVAGDARFRGLQVDLAASAAEPDVYFPFAQRTDRDLEVAVRTSDGVAMSAATLQAAVANVDRALPLYSVRTLSAAVAQQTALARFGAWLLGAFSVGALLLSAIGLYGLIAYVVGLSRREIAIRLALGADARRVLALIVRNGMTLVAAGLAVGALAAYAAARALETQLFRTSAGDAVTYGTVSVVLVIVALCASVIPARRAVRVEPHAALRAD